MLKKNIFYNSLFSISNFLFPLITFPYSSRILGPEGIGAVVFVDSITTYFILVSFLGIPLYAVRETGKRRNDPVALNKIASEILFIHIASVAAFALIYLSAAFAVPVLRQRIDLVCVGIVSMFVNVFTIEWFYQGTEKFRYIGIRSIISKTLSVIFLFVFLRKESPLIIYYLFIVSGPAINAVLNTINLRKHCTINFKGLALKQHITPLLTILGSSLASSVYLIMDVIMLGFMKGDVAVGIYNTAMRIVKLPYAIIGSISTVIIPQMARAYKEADLQTIKSLIHKSFSFVCVVAFPIATGIFLESHFLVEWLAGERFMNSIPVVKILAWVIILIGLAHIFGLQILNAIGKEKLVFRAVLTGMIFSLSANLCLIPLLSYTGSAITNLLTEVVVSASVFHYARKFVNVQLDKDIFFKCLFGVALFFPIAFCIRQLNIQHTVAEITIIITCGAAYVTFLWFFGNNVYIENMKQNVLTKLKRQKTEAGTNSTFNIQHSTQ